MALVMNNTAELGGGSFGFNPEKIRQSLKDFESHYKVLAVDLPKKMNDELFNNGLKQDWISELGKEKITLFVKLINESLTDAVVKSCDEIADRINQAAEVMDRALNGNDGKYQTYYPEVRKFSVSDDNIKSDIAGDSYIYEDRLKNDLSLAKKIQEQYRQETEALKESLTNVNMYDRNGDIQSLITNKITYLGSQIKYIMDIRIIDTLEKVINDTTEETKNAKERAAYLIEQFQAFTSNNS